MDGSRDGEPVNVPKLYAVARKASVRWRGLAPLGGLRWSRKDLERAVSELLLVTRSRGFRRADSRGLSDNGQSRYLLRALRNALLKRKERISRAPLLSPPTIDETGSRRHHHALSKAEAHELAGSLRKGLSPGARGELLRRLLGGGPPSVLRLPDHEWPSRATRARRWARVRVGCRALAAQEGLSRHDFAMVIRALAGP